MRTRQTLLSMLEAFRHQRVQTTSEPRLREQDFGNFQNARDMEKVYEERQKFGRFFFRFPNGEAGTDVYDRVCDFWGTIYRFMDFSPRDDRHVDNFVMVTHGLLMRIFCMCYFRWTVLEFERVWNPSNCEIWVLEKTKSGRYRLAGQWSHGALKPIKFGSDDRQELYEHMRKPLAARQFVPGSLGALDDPSLQHFRVPEREKVPAPSTSETTDRGSDINDRHHLEDGGHSSELRRPIKKISNVLGVGEKTLHQRPPRPQQWW